MISDFQRWSYKLCELQGAMMAQDIEAQANERAVRFLSGTQT
jgi:hypothetical protein